MKGWPLTAALLGVLAASDQAAAQKVAADAVLASGRVDAAESLYFRRAAQRPRDPVARQALGRYLGARGAFRVGAVLLEEARDFGADPRLVARELAPLYRALGDFRALARLPESPLTPEERAHAAWLVSRPQTLEMPDSVIVRYRAPRDTGSLGRVTLAFAGMVVDATIDPRRTGIVIDTSLHALPGFSQVLADDRMLPLGAIASVRIGDATLGNVPAAIQPLAGARAVIGLDVLRAFAPTFDPLGGRLVLRRGGRVAAQRAGTRAPLLLGSGDVLVLHGRRFVPIAGREMLHALGGRQWTLDVRRGAIVLE